MDLITICFIFSMFNGLLFEFTFMHLNMLIMFMTNIMFGSLCIIWLNICMGIYYVTNNYDKLHEGITSVNNMMAQISKDNNPDIEKIKYFVEKINKCKKVYKTIQMEYNNFKKSDLIIDVTYIYNKYVTELVNDFTSGIKTSINKFTDIDIDKYKNNKNNIDNASSINNIKHKTKNKPNIKNPFVPVDFDTFMTNMKDFDSFAKMMDQHMVNNFNAFPVKYNK